MLARPSAHDLCSFDENERRGVISSTPRMCPRKGLWRGVGERPLRGLYSALASSSPSHQSAIISFVKKPPPDRRDKFGPAVSTSSRSAPRSGNAATLSMLQMESRHAASATPTAFWRRKHGHERQPAHPCMCAPPTGDSAAMMKRGGAEVAPAHLERVRRTPEWCGSRKCHVLRQGGARPTVPGQDVPA